MREEIFAFADEYGNNSFDFQSQGTHFIVSAVITTKNNLPQLEAEIEEVRKRHFQTGEIKSQKVASDHWRRTKILNQIVQSDFHIYSVVVDKRLLKTEGFKYKQSFYKFLNGIVYRELYKSFPDLQMTVDEYGDNDFMRGFKKYVEKEHIPKFPLFSNFGFVFTKSPDNVLIQLADFVAGTLGRCFDETKKSKDTEIFLEILKPKITSISFFPNENHPLDYQPEQEEEGYNPLIAEHSVNIAQNFIANSGKNLSPQEVDQINCVKLLLLYFKAYDYRKYVSTKEIMNQLSVDRKTQMKLQYFRTKVIGELRDKGIIIASKSSGLKTGYKLPTSSEDLYHFVNHGNSIIIPMLARIKRCRDQINLATRKDLDILDKPEYQELKRILESCFEQ